MVKKLSIRYRIKAVIEALKEGEKTWSELVNLGIPEKTLERVLKDYLIYWGLVKKEGDYYVWHEYIRTYHTRREYEVALSHSKRIIPELLVLISPSTNASAEELCFSAKEHLRTGYPKIYEKLVKIKKFLEEQKRLEQENSKQKTTDIFEEANRRFLTERIYAKILSDKEDFARKVNKNDPSLHYDVHMTIRHSYDVLYRMGSDEAIINIFTEFVRDILFLTSKIENGEPLKGKCAFCPDIKILKQAN